ncbi:glucodextranase DOMON-like domain-containing protein [Natronoarchaeum rubrum]|uniref:glucodextranase DOMON-like domain-containing protein n=1 Tax=Natronoarchaeum rubrum TaxID=755311 RepID=UPI0021123815|nr:glucodextranase DOMON-like domain-containing protein [Natronoarchaeum rubrum]
MSNNDNLTPTTNRRSVLGGIAGLGALSLSSGYGSAETQPALQQAASNGADSHHPGEPRFVEVGESLRNSIYVDGSHVFDRDNLAPRVVDIDADAANYSADDFQWSLAESPDGSSGDVLAFETDDEDGEPRWDDGKKNVAEFTADAPGTYVVEVDAPDGTHEMTIHAFPATPDGAGGPPRLSLDAEFDSEAGEFVIESNAKLSPNSNANPEDLTVEFLADDRDALSTSDIVDEGTTARVPASAISGDAARVHAAPYDGDVHGMADTVMLDADGEVHLPNRPPEWMKDGVMYEIFTRSFAGERGETDMQYLTERVSYLDELGIDAVWLTPIYPSVSSSKELAGGGPHGYDATDYMSVASDLGTVEEYKAFIEECNANDIKVVFDMVINHAGRDHPYFQDTIASKGDEVPAESWEFLPVEEWNQDSKYFDWFDRMDAPITGPDGGVVDPAPGNTGFWGLRLQPNWNFDNMALREHMLAVADFWSGEVGVDGFRCDIAWGTPHSFWKEVRDLVRSNNSEFLMLDESIPKDPHFAENEFDMHFDTSEFMNTMRGIGRDNAPANEILSSINSRKAEGFPEHTLILNTTENHDEERLLNQIIEGGTRDNPKKAQRACWAAGVTLPGVPFVYYGQERAISEYGEGRHMGEDDPRSGDIFPGGKKRAFMNWDEYDEEHLQFYKDLIGTYQEMDVLKPDADMAAEWFATAAKAEPNLLVFGRDASHLDDVEGPETVVVVINFEEEPSQVNLRPEVSTTDLLSGEDLSIPSGASAAVAEVDTIAIFETPSLLPTGQTVFETGDPTGDDIGPGQPDTEDGTAPYTYPTGDGYADGTFDIDTFRVHETEDHYQFIYGVDTEVTNPDDLEYGLSHQHLQVYVRDGNGDGGATSARTGVNAEFAEPYHYRVVADGENGARLEDADGNELATGNVKINNAVYEIIAEIPKRELNVPTESMQLAPLMLGYDGSAEGGVMPVESEASANAFGGAENGSAPNVIDMVSNDNTTQAAALAYSEGELAQIPYVLVTTEFQEVASFDDPTGDGMASGQYTLPTADAYYENAWDIASFSVEASRSRVRFNYTMAEELQNPWSFGTGFSQQMFQIYVASPNAGGPSGTEGRGGTNLGFAQPYHYRVVVHGEGTLAVENAAGEAISTDVNVVTDGKTVSIDVPRGALDWSHEETGMALQPITVPYDGYGTKGVRGIAESNSQHAIGGGTGTNDPAAMDILTPEGTDQASVLSDYSADSTVSLPFVTVGNYGGGGSGSGSGDGGDGDGSGDGSGNESSGNESQEEGSSSDGLPGFGVAAGAAGVAGAAAAASRLSDDEDDEE